MTSLNKLTITEAIKGIKAKKFSGSELVSDCLSRIKQTEPELNAFVTVNHDSLQQAKKIDTGQPLAGIPIAIKDNYCVKNILTTASSKLLDNFYPKYTATVVDNLSKAGAIIIGKTNMDAWAHGSSTETSDFGPSKNPWDTDRLPGGSSGGSAVAVMADQAIAAIGSETAGSIRQPASWCGCVGFKPTYGRCSRYGLVAMKSSTDSPGPLTKTVDDAALLLSIMSGHDPKDATSIDQPAWSPPTAIKSLKGLKIGLPSSYFPEQTQPEVKKAVLNATDILKQLGAQIVDLNDVLDPKYSIAVYTILQRSEVSSNLSRFDGVRYGRDRSYFGQEAKNRIMLGTYTLSAGYYDAFYLKAQKVRSLIVKDFDKQFAKVDAIVGPVSPVTALSVGASTGQAMFGEIQDMLLEPSSIAGLPGISIPCGFDNQGLPVGLQIIAPQQREDVVYQIAKLFEQTTDYHLKRPKL